VQEPVLSRTLERIVVRDYIYRALLSPPAPPSISDQFAFRSTGSTTAALILILHTVTHLLDTNPHVIVIALDFSKAFDSLRHSTLMEKFAALDIPDNIYNWLVDFFQRPLTLHEILGTDVSAAGNLSQHSTRVRHWPYIICSDRCRPGCCDSRQHVMKVC